MNQFLASDLLNCIGAMRLRREIVELLLPENKAAEIAVHLAAMSKIEQRMTDLVRSDVVWTWPIVEREEDESLTPAQAGRDRKPFKPPYTDTKRLREWTSSYQKGVDDRIREADASKANS